MIVPDQPGYNVSSKPLRIADYSVPYLVSDVMAIGDQLGAERFFLRGRIGEPRWPGPRRCCIRSDSASWRF